MSTDLQASYLPPVSRRTKRKCHSDDEEAVKRSRGAHRSSYTATRPLKRRKTKKTGSAPPHSDCDVRNDLRTPHQDAFRSSPTLCPSDTHSHLHQFSDAKSKCPTSPVHSPPSPSSPKTRMLQRQQVDWTYLSDTEDTVVSGRTVGACTPETPAGRNSGDRIVADDSDDTGYDGASEWEGLSDASLQGRFSMKDVILIHSDDGRTIFTRQHASTCLADGGRRASAEDCCRSASSRRIEPTLRSYTPSPMNSEDYKRINDALVNRVPSPLSPRNVGNAEHEHSERPHVIVCYPFCDSPEPLSEGFGSPCRVTSPNLEVKEVGEPWPDDVPQDRDVSYGSLEQNIDSRHQDVRRDAAAFKSQPSRTYVACSAYMQAAYHERGRLWPVFDWSCPHPVDQDSPFSVNEPDELGSKKVATTQFDFLHGDKGPVNRWAREVVTVGTENTK